MSALFAPLHVDAHRGLLPERRKRGVTCEPVLEPAHARAPPLRRQAEPARAICAMGPYGHVSRAARRGPGAARPFRACVLSAACARAVHACRRARASRPRVLKSRSRARSRQDITKKSSSASSSLAPSAGPGPGPDQPQVQAPHAPHAPPQQPQGFPPGPGAVPQQQIVQLCCRRA
jgi:hypothetical protein